ncbi:hypothetical protein COV93_03465 [Candidatus Woesearchaeota archaeon CG11_big_fil_rev_8_21_14_0_20_43_8]|nr:MAG: hypothetical protein COV93_03465 [Candidatus Woesearchaeota archaeon CG11_big_fil_rev_8_21_14_0_20_43_8]PIO05070.1 MAG: hypothetical protein COT47_06415 [Candidatus Woesearchaeota archaeon CG08_land_8_20_14_0_20_43_7]
MPKRNQKGKKKTTSKQINTKAIDKKLNQIIDNQKKILNKETEIESMEESDMDEEKRIERLDKEEIEELHHVEDMEREEIDELRHLEHLEDEIKKEVGPHPLRKITYRDFVKAVIGAVFGIVGHFAFLYGTHLAEDISVFRATILYLISFLIAVGFIYYSGFRKVKGYRVLRFIPVRVVTIYFISLLVIVLVLLAFGLVDISNGFERLYKEVGAISILAILGACTADLVGRE